MHHCISCFPTYACSKITRLKQLWIPCSWRFGGVISNIIKLKCEIKTWFAFFFAPSSSSTCSPCTLPYKYASLPSHFYLLLYHRPAILWLISKTELTSESVHRHEIVRLVAVPLSSWLLPSCSHFPSIHSCINSSFKHSEQILPFPNSKRYLFDN